MEVEECTSTSVILGNGVNGEVEVDESIMVELLKCGFVEVAAPRFILLKPLSCK